LRCGITRAASPYATLVPLEVSRENAQKTPVPDQWIGHKWDRGFSPHLFVALENDQRVV
jgi:hypothetical protein